MSERRPDEERFDWIEAVVKVAELAGLNGMRVRWKLRRMQLHGEKAAEDTAGRVSHARYEHKTCDRCGAINDRESKVCSSCGERISGRAWQVFRRIGLSVPGGLTASSLLCLAMVLIYLRMIGYQIGASAGAPASVTWGLWGFDGNTLIRFGGHWPPAVEAGQWWRLGTAIFLHAGIAHIGFNAFALWQIGPAIERLHGRGRTVFLFMLTGLVASAASGLFLEGVGIGASGAIMGLLGLAAGWGQRDGTTVGRNIRNRMVKWAIYVLLFGFFIGADNVAHGAGFLTGAALGFVLPVKRGVVPGVPAMAQGLIGGAAAVACVVLCLFPPATSDEWAGGTGRQLGHYPGETVAIQGMIDYMLILDEVCPTYEAGHANEAFEALASRLDLEGDWAELFDTDEMRRTYIESVCDQLQSTRDLCVRFRESGVDALLQGAQEEHVLDREYLQRYYEGACTALDGP